MNVIIATLGTLGDLIPYVTLGRALAAHGHAVTILTNDIFRGHVQAHGLGFHAIACADAFRHAFEHGNVWRLRGGVHHAFESQNRLAVLPAYHYIRTRAERGERFVVLATHNAYGARFACERLDLPLAAMTLSPFWLRTRQPPIHPLPPHLPGPLADLCYRFADRFLIDPQVGTGLNACRREMGLPPARRFFHDWHACADLHLGLYPDWFAMLPPGRPSNLRMTGFPLQAPGAMPMHAAAAEFVERHGKPLVFTTGTGVADVADFFAASARLSARLDRPGIFLSRHPVPLPPTASPPLARFDYVDLAGLLPHAAALIHHGGVGTCAEAIRAGIPQLITPLAHDQPDNARRIRRLGLGAAIGRRRYLRGDGARQLASLLASPDVTARLAGYRRRIAEDNGVDRAVATLEAHWGKSARGRLSPESPAAATHTTGRSAAGRM
ncbi:MAG: glycosyltransferase [Nevskiales bacterium]|nr:glycosyltransferase [Nevskiales bacterium]